MFEAEDPTNPYDNVEFPAKKPATGTWSAGTSPGGGSKLLGVHGGHQSTGRAVLAGPKLAPLVEVDGAENQETQRLLPPSPSSATSNSSSPFSSPSSPSSIGPAGSNRHVIQNKAFSTNTLPSSQKATPAPNPIPLTTGVNSAPDNTTKATTTSFTSSASQSSSSATTTTTMSNASTDKQNNFKAHKPVITVPNDTNLYVTTQGGEERSQANVKTSTKSRSIDEIPGADKKKTLKQTEAEEEDFKRQDLNPGARAALEKVYTLHPDFYQLNTKVLDEGSLLKQDVMEIYRKTGESLNYEQLLQGMLVDGERFLLGSCWLYYMHVQFLDIDGKIILRAPYGRGRVGLTSKRAMFLSTETFTDANLEPFDEGEGKKKQAGYKLEVSKRSNVTFKNIPLTNFHSAEMEISTGTAAQTKITKKEPSCCSCFSFRRGGQQWTASPPMTRSINSRVLRVGVSMPPWQTRMFLDIHLDPAMSLTVARDFISQLHAYAPHMH
ncbi:hypothetical protein EGW08_003082 [Elysia chlorotica]|uniref:Uncharacterized protein n=1 Tax=Elysia chlorotica TaxID=188477 RepID=A0A433U5L3_ELYCH|nr:hypothetical protein EGW08_003082 [Elysia chlorotica]